jgi:hypothetical protein
MTIGDYVPETCAICGRQFHPLEGTRCVRCRRMLCARHFHDDGSSQRRNPGDVDPLCDDCAAAPGAPPGPPDAPRA